MKPLFVINFKTYKQGKSVIDLAKKIEKFSRTESKGKYQIIIGVQVGDIYETTKSVKIPVFAQHVDCPENHKKGRATGFILPEAVKKDKAEGTFLNHSEHKLSFSVLKKTIKRCKKIKLKTLVFVSSVKQAKKIEKLKPDYLAYESPELVGTKKSVSKSKSGVIEKLKKQIKMKFLIGAGIHSEEDVKKAIELGACGIAISSAITKSKNPEKKLKELLK